MTSVEAKWVFPNRLRAARESAGLTQVQVAEQMRQAGHGQFDTAIVSRLERGQREVSLKEAVALAQIVGEPLDRLLDADALDEPPWDRLYFAVRSLRAAEERVSATRAAWKGSQDQLRVAAAETVLPWTQAFSVLEEEAHRRARGVQDEPVNEVRLGLLRQAWKLLDSAKQHDRLAEAKATWPQTTSLVQDPK